MIQPRHLRPDHCGRRPGRDLHRAAPGEDRAGADRAHAHPGKSPPPASQTVRRRPAAGCGDDPAPTGAWTSRKCRTATWTGPISITTGRASACAAEKKGAFAFRTIRRHEFDAWLAGKAREAGFLIQENTAVKRISASGEEVRARNRPGRVPRPGRGRRGRVEQRRPALRRPAGSHPYRPPAGDRHRAAAGEILPRPGELLFRLSCMCRRASWGTAGISPPWKTAGRCGCAASTTAMCIRLKTDISLQAALADEFGRHGYRLEEYKLEGHPLRWFEPKSAFSAPHVLLAGDAAGADALFGEGISIALGYGGLAAQAIKEAFARQDFSFRDYRRSHPALRNGQGPAAAHLDGQIVLPAAQPPDPGAGLEKAGLAGGMGHANIHDRLGQPGGK